SSGLQVDAQSLLENGEHRTHASNDLLRIFRSKAEHIECVHGFCELDAAWAVQPLVHGEGLLLEFVLLWMIMGHEPCCLEKARCQSRVVLVAMEFAPHLERLAEIGPGRVHVAVG